MEVMLAESSLPVGLSRMSWPILVTSVVHSSGMLIVELFQNCFEFSKGSVVLGREYDCKSHSGDGVAKS